MTKEFLDHYLKGGYFNAIYDPKVTMDLKGDSTSLIGKKIIVYQNMIINPLITPAKYEGQHAFNSPSIYGWFPEEDIKIIEKVNTFLDTPERLPVYMYKLHYTDQEQVDHNFGKGRWSVPMVVGREYSTNMDNYVLSLSKPQATRIEKALYTGDDDNIVWEQLYPQES